MHGDSEFAPARLDLADDVGEKVGCHRLLRGSVLLPHETSSLVIDRLNAGLRRGVPYTANRWLRVCVVVAVSIAP
jgi:hypothetical protein